ncbi:MAG: PCMD domain-containing protein [Prevotellaceae bacterium]|jgi:hypothetical protein|nr:PCMD domain-containing protein [Prevotellaceae bacterium]
MNKHLTIAAACLAALAACTENEHPSSEADILTFALPPSIGIVENEVRSSDIYLKVPHENWGKLSSAAPTITLSAGASITPASGAAVDLTGVGFAYTVTAQDGKTVKTYTLSLTEEYTADTVLFSFEGWQVAAAGYQRLSNADWSSGNGGVNMGMLVLGGIDTKDPTSYPTQKTTEGYAGNAVLLETKLGGSKPPFLDVPVWAGNCFLGSFEASTAIASPLDATAFGRAYKRRPIALQGYYKYREGAGKYNHNGEEIVRPDSCSIYAVLYRCDDGEATLTAYDINTSPRVVARADLADGASTAGDEFQPFDIPFRYASEPDFAGHKYKLAVVFSSSAVGAAPVYVDGKPTKKALYAGKVGSRLIVDEVRIVNQQ